MNELQKQLNMISQTLSLLSDQIEMVSGYLKKEILEEEVSAETLAPAEAVKPVEVEQKKVEKPKKIAVKIVKTEPEAMESIASGVEKHTEILKTVLEVIKRSRKGTSIKNLREKTGFGPRQVSNALYKLTKQGVIKTKARGVYVKA